ncbi:MAG: DNA polymerase III subunit gamma/tau [Oscillospiraceae bacterium]|nr:DNA polymerase III subunit gamma/tau [Oscillospiraceae bacterium]
MYQALYRKYRPRTFDEVVGQKSITQTLKTQVSANRLSHAYLFTGTRGTGKTSCAKILARAVNCLSPVDGNPCNHCAACRSIEEGACMDVLEIDAASNRGIDHVRALRDDAIYSPSEVKYRIYIIDEVHMLTIESFNALLKIIEEPPEHLIFILATTELHKVPATILSRCQRFSFRRLLQEDIASRLAYVAYQEGIDLEPEAARVLARLADGALRDGVSLLDQCASATEGTLTPDAVYNCLGLAGDRSVYALLKAVAQQNASAALSLFSRLYGEGKDIGAMLDEMCAAARDLLIMKTVPQGGLSMISGICTGPEAEELAPQFSAGELIHMVSVLQETMSHISKSANLRVEAELCLISLCTPSLHTDSEALNARLTRLEERLASGAFVAAAPAAPQRAQAAGDPDEEEEERPPFPDDADAPAAPEEQRAAPQSGLPAGFWADLTSALREEFRPPVRSFFGQNGPLTAQLRGEVLYLCGQEFEKNMVNKPEVLQTVAQKASVLLGYPVRVEFHLTGQRFDGGHDKMEDLLSLQSTLGDRMTIK